ISSTENDLPGGDGSGGLSDLDVRRQIPIKLLSKPPLRSKPPPRTQRPGGGRPCKGTPGEDDKFGFKQEERFDCGTKAGDVFGSQRRFPQPLFWDYKLNLIGERDKLPIHFCDKCGLPIQLYGRMVSSRNRFIIYYRINILFCNNIIHVLMLNNMKHQRNCRENKTESSEDFYETDSSLIIGL
uniref:Cbl proto-oncogene like 1 n=1 Tax=Cyprinodon variegatus TaxID=28743 RepID=A0A3Q2D593_CYPVA